MSPRTTHRSGHAIPRGVQASPVSELSVGVRVFQKRSGRESLWKTLMLVGVFVAMAAAVPGHGPDRALQIDPGDSTSYSGATTSEMPSWTPSYSMRASTIMMPCNYSGFFDAHHAAQWGIASFDWSNGKDVWANAKPMDCEASLLKQAEMTKEINPQSKTWVYRNLVKATRQLFIHCTAY